MCVIRTENLCKTYKGGTQALCGLDLEVPYRVYGFGPYAEVLDGLDYVGTDGLLPHRLVGDWVAARASAVFCEAGLVPALEPCAAVLEPAGR